jgi:formylglycine-generating enzyme required for sulfatase activity
MVSFETEPVGQLTPNGYGLYDMFGLVQEHVLLKSSLFRGDLGFASCLKGGDYHVSLEDGSDDTLSPYWKWISYGYYEPGHQGYGAGFRLIRNIGNNAKWTYLKSK